MNEKNSIIPKGLRILNICAGISYLVISAILLFNKSFEETTILNILAFNLLLMGIMKLINGFYSKVASKKWMLGNIISAVIIFLIGIVIIVYPDMTLYGSIILVAISLLIQGIYRIMFGIFNKKISVLATVLNISFGLLSIGLTINVMFHQDIAIYSLATLLVIIFILNGLLRIYSGLRGYIKIEEK